MSTPTTNTSPRELAVASLGGFAWAALGLALWGGLPNLVQATPCRVHNHLASGATSVGSGTLVDVTATGERGLVLSCAHLFSEGAGRVTVEFPDGRTHGALVTAIDARADLAALEIARPTAKPTAIDALLAPTGRLRTCGFGPSGQYRCLDGLALGFSERPGQRSVRIAGAVRSGDSGGGVFDADGELTGVVWGACDGETYASTGGPLLAFLDRLLPARRGAAPSGMAPGACPDGRCPLTRPGSPSDAAAGGAAASAGDGAASAGGIFGVNKPPANRPGCGCGDELAALADRLGKLEQPGVGGAPPAASPPAAEGFAGAARLLATLAVTILGISGPAGWGVIAGASVAGWLIGRRRKSKLRVASRELREKDQTQELATRDSHLATPPEATTAAAVSFPIERDDREARELLRLSQLEGRDPLQDAVAGRLALDRLDALAEGDADPLHATWADKLRRELRERFNDIAPTKFHVNAECRMGNGD